MRKLQFHTDKRAVKRIAGETAKRTAAGAAVAIFMALQITGCSQAGRGQGEQAATSAPAQAGNTDGEKTDGQTEGQSAGEERTSQQGEKQGKEQGKEQGETKTGAQAENDGQEVEPGGGDSAQDFKPGMPVKEGVMAPDFTAQLLDGASITLSELQGKPVIINFWATWCGPCVREMPAFERLKEDFGDKIGIIAVNCGDDTDTVKDFVEENGYTFPIALDEEFAVSMLYPTSSIPYTVVLDAQGKVTHVSAGAADADTMYERYKEALGL